MGEWGEGIFQNDIGADCKSLTVKLLGDGLDGAEVEAELRILLPDYFDGVEDPETENQAILAVSLTLHSYGFLEPELRIECLRRIEEELAGKVSKSRRKHFEKALQNLQSDQPTRKRPKKQIPYIAPFEPGDFVAVPVSESQIGLIYVTGRTFRSICGDQSNTVRILGPLTSSFRPDVPPDVPYLMGQEFEKPERYFTLKLTSRPAEVKTLGRFFPPPDNRPESLKLFFAEQERLGNVRLPASEDGFPTNGGYVDWNCFLDAIRTVIVE